MNILEIAKSYLSNDVVGNVARSTGESESAISKVISAALPTILGGLISKSASNPGSTLDIVKGAAGSGVLGNLGSLVGTDDPSTPTTSGFSIWNAIKNIFGDKVGSIISMLSSFGGVKEASANNVLGLTSAAALGAVGKYTNDHNLDANGLASYLSSQQSNVSAAVPTGFDFSKISGFLGLGALGTAASHATAIPSSPKVAPTATSASYAQQQPKKGNNWLVPVLLLIAVALIAWWLSKSCNKNDTTVPMTDTTTTTEVTTNEDTAPTTMTTSRESTVITLPSGTTLNAYKGGIEDQIVQFLQSDEYKNATEDQLKDKWFNFDNLNFEFGSTKLTSESQVQLDNLVAILKEFKDAKIKIGAYTDKKGDDAVNQKLSQSRADAVKSALDAAGVKAQVSGAEGYGEQFATVDETADDAAREADRKTAIRFTK